MLINKKDIIKNLCNSWKKELKQEFEENYFQNIINELNNALKDNKLCPHFNKIFSALNTVDINHVKVIILGQDPYHGLGQANGLSFSVNNSTPIPPSLKNIIKEIQLEYPNVEINNGNLIKWAKQGVLLLNSSLTVIEGIPNSHSKIGWQQFTDQIIKILSRKKKNLVFLLWGKFAQQKEDLIYPNKHLVLKTTHPSPFSAHKGFIGCNHFKKTNVFLKTNGIKTINWSI